MPPFTLTTKMLQCLRLIQDLTDAAGGVAPSIGTLTSHLGLKSKSGGHRLVSSLVERGYVERIPGKARALRLVHRLTPIATSPAMTALVKALATAVPNENGEVRVIMPKAMIDGVAAELGLTPAQAA